MDSSRTNPCILILCCVLILLQSVDNLIIDNHKLIYNQCPNQTSPKHPSHSSLLTALFQEFLAQSSKSRFFETIVADDETAISGTFQCRNNLSPDECRSCVSKFPVLSGDLCGQNLPARIQLSGCYIHYQEEEDDGAEDNNSRPGELLHRACSKHKVKKNGFEEMKYAAFAALESGLISGNGFFETTYGSIHVVAECAGSLGGCDCGECVSNAAQIDAEDECRYSVSGEIYLEGCFVSYKYEGGHGFGGYSFEDNGNGDSSSKLVAIAIGGLSAVLLGLALCYFIRSCGKKRDDW